MLSLQAVRKIAQTCRKEAGPLHCSPPDLTWLDTTLPGQSFDVFRRNEWLLGRQVSAQVAQVQAEADVKPLRMFFSTPWTLVGRSELLRKINALLVRIGRGSRTLDNSAAAVRVLLYGPPGVGKTALVRSLGSQLACAFPRQYFFQAKSTDTLQSDIDLFLQSVGCPGKGVPTFSRFLHCCDEEFLLIFEDVSNADETISLLPRGKHCIIFTSVSNIDWLGHCHVEQVLVPPLLTIDSFSLDEKCFRRVPPPSSFC